MRRTLRSSHLPDRPSLYPPPPARRRTLAPPQLLAEIQRTWSYLESLFIGSDEVKKELPDATQRFARIDTNIKSVLRVGGQPWLGGGGGQARARARARPHLRVRPRPAAALQRESDRERRPARPAAANPAAPAAASAGV
jgi:hypothetical protein